ncbi:MarR family transcriptional regulator [Streptomyces sp. NPDC048636]|uniref:MarR family winged helix-turn-helix transcriptional regulator n=1 Tax=Streptomyces sp. NPDC048636 TaxID=3155762 RepID=UPI003436B08E
METAPPSLLRRDTYLLAKVGKAVRARLGARMAARQLRLWHMAVLAALDDFGPRSQRQLAARLTLHPSDVTRVVDDLVERGWVVRTRDPADRRRVSVRLTPEGEEALRRLEAEASAVEDEILSPLTPDARAELSTALRLVFDHLHQGSGEDEPVP